MSRNPIALTARSQVDTAAFRAWFGDSKVVDRNCRPLVVYHGTSVAVIDTFYGGWWSESKCAAKEFGPETYSAYLKIENPAYDEDLATLYVEFSGAPYDDENASTNLRDEAMSGGAFSCFVRSKGHDGIATWDDSNSVEAMAYVPFEPNQIKSVTGNRGTFDPANPDIRFSNAARERER